jgi:hypothetical protein
MKVRPEIQELVVPGMNLLVSYTLHGSSPTFPSGEGIFLTSPCAILKFAAF